MTQNLVTNDELIDAYNAKQGDAPTVLRQDPPAFGWAAGLDYDADIYERLIGVGSDVGAMDKQQVQSFKAFAVDDVYSKLRPLFTKWGIAILPTVNSVDYVMHDRGGDKTPAIDARVQVTYRFYAPNGSTTQMTFVAEGRDYSDKATNKAVQQAFKYGLIQMFMISTGEVEPDSENIEIEAPEPNVSPGEKWMNTIKIAAWSHTEGDQELRVVEATAIVEQALSVYGGEPENAADVAAIVANIDAMFDTEGTDS